MKATGRSGLLACAAAEMAGVPVGQFYDDDLDRSLRNLALGVPGPRSVPAGLSIESPHDPAHAFREDGLVKV